MGYKRTRKRYKLRFEDPDLAGFEVVMGSLSIGEFMDLTSMVQADPKEGAASTNRLLGKFSRSIVSWNLEDDDGRPVPATLEGVQTQELGFIMQVVMAWMDAIAAVDPTSRAGANGGGTFPEVSLPMEPLSPSLPN